MRRITDKVLRHMAAGFTMMELVMVIVVLGIVGVSTVNFVGLGATVYSDVVGREQTLSQSRFMMERLTREIREALPNSVRVGVFGDIHCLEFVPIKASSSYVDIPVAPETASVTISVVQHAVTPLDADKIAVYPLTSTDVYNKDTPGGTTFTLNTIPSDGTTSADYLLANAYQFKADSPTQRYYLVKNAISYCADTSTGGVGSGQIKRYAGYWPPTAAQNVPPLNQVSGAVTGVLMAEGLKSGSVPFAYSGATLVANALVQAELTFVRDGEELTFHHEVHLVNVP